MLSDVHGNFVALDAVLRDLARRGVEGVLHLGDLVGFGPNSDEVVTRIREEGISGVVGDHDLAAARGQIDRWGFDPRTTRAVGPTSRGAAPPFPRIREETCAFLNGLPAQLRVTERETRFLLVHGSPESPDEPLSLETPKERLSEILRTSGAEVLLVGHTHVAAATPVGDRLLLNPGSVGRPMGADPRASYLVLDTEAGLSVEHIRVEFEG